MTDLGTLYSSLTVYRPTIQNQELVNLLDQCVAQLEDQADQKLISEYEPLVRQGVRREKFDHPLEATMALQRVYGRIGWRERPAGNTELEKTYEPIRGQPNEVFAAKGQKLVKNWGTLVLDALKESPDGLTRDQIVGKLQSVRRTIPPASAVSHLLHQLWAQNKIRLGRSRPEVWFLEPPKVETAEVPDSPRKWMQWLFDTLDEANDQGCLTCAEIQNRASKISGQHVSIRQIYEKAGAAVKNQITLCQVGDETCYRLSEHRPE